MGILSALMIKIGADTSEAVRGIREVQGGMQETEKKSGGFGQTLSKGAKVAGTAIGAAVTAVVGFGKSSVDAGMEFDKSMSQVAATMGYSVDDINTAGTEASETFNRLRGFAMEMGETTAFSAKQSADALNYMALAGYDADTSMQMLPTVLNLAAAGSLDLASASDMVTDAQSALGLSLDETSTMVDQMAVTSSKSNTSVGQLGEAFLTIGATARNVAGGTQELSTVLGVLADNGIKGAEGGTHLRNMIMSLQNPTDAGAAALRQLGISVYDSDGNMRSLISIIGDLQVGMQDMDQASRDAILNGLFNKTDVAAVNALLGTTGTRYRELYDSIGNAAGAAQQMAGVQLDNLAGDVTLFKSALEGAQIAISDQLTPTLRTFVQYGSDAIGELVPTVTGMLNQIMPPLLNLVKSLLPAIMKIIDALAPVISEILDAIVPIVEAVLPVLVDLIQQILPPITRLIQQILPTVTRLIQGILKVLEPILQFVGPILDVIVDLLEPLNELIDGALDPLLEVLGTIFGALGELLGPVMEIIKVVNSIVMPIVKALNGVLGSIIQVIANVISAIVQFAAKINNAVLGKLLEVINGVKNAFSGIGQFFSNLGSSIKGFFDGIGQWFSAQFTAAANGIRNAFSGIGQFFSGIWNGIVNVFSGVANWFGNIFSGAVTAIRNGWNSVVGFFQGIWNGITNVFSSVGNWFGNIFSGAVTAIKNGWNNIVSWFKGIWNGISSVFQNVGNWFSERFTAAKEGVQRAFSTVGDFFKGVWDKISGVFSGVGTWFSDRFKEVVAGIKRPFEKIGEWFKGIWNGIKGVFKLPHLQITGGFSLIPPKVPKFSVQWYARAYDQPMLFTKPTVLPTTNGLKGFGDGHGAELVIGMSKLHEMLSDAASNNVNINVYASPYQSAEDVAREVQKVFVRWENQKKVAFA